MRKCQKAKYNTKKDALTVLNYVKKHSNRKKIPRRPYFCKICKTWHMTSEIARDKITYEFKLPEDRQIVNKINEIISSY